MAIPDPLRRRIQQRLRSLYGDDGPEVCARLLERLDRFPTRGTLTDPTKRQLPFDQRDVVLITYGDSLRAEGSVEDAPRAGAERPTTLQAAPDPPLSVLRRFAESRLKGLISTIHILPFFPYSSDDGFSVIDFHAVDPTLGGWEEVEALAGEFRLVFDLVLNHISSQSPWFQSYLAGEPPLLELAIEVDPSTDLSAVTRPRALPLLSEYQRKDGAPVQVWTTFSADQIDLNYASPDVLLAMVDVVLDYVERGARMLRLDAVAYLWKEIGTSCIHLPKTHEAVRLLRDIFDLVAPETALLTETNVPHPENVSYFGDGTDEAQLVYNFSLPPLVLHALCTGSAEHLTRWAAALQAPTNCTTFFNFTASHDGVGVRPLEGILPAEEIAWLADLCRRRGGRVSGRTMPDGSTSPYELNVTYVDALRGTDEPEGDAHHVARFLSSQAVALSLPGVPAIYIGSLLGSRNWEEGVIRSGQARTINRQKLKLVDVGDELDDIASLRHRIFSGLAHLLQVRTAQPAFAPDAAMEVLRLDPRCLALVRRCETQQLLVLINVSAERVELSLPDAFIAGRDLLGGDGSHDGAYALDPYGVAWLW